LAFSSGAALAVLEQVVGHSDVPQAVWRSRLALHAAENAMVLMGRPERAADLRDEVAFLRPGDLPGPGGRNYLQWKEAVDRLLTRSRLQKVVPDPMRQRLEDWMRPGPGGPVSQAAQVLASVLEVFPRDEGIALILADAALSRALGWKTIVPLLGLSVKRRDLGREQAELIGACHRGVINAAKKALPMAEDLAHRSMRLQALESKTRSKGKAQAIGLFLSNEAVAPSPTLSRIMSDRSARRFCDRMVELGGLRELTGRSSFRLYGL
jgi:hypothetical protein